MMKEDPDVLRCQAGAEVGADEVRQGVADFLTRSYNSHVSKWGVKTNYFGSFSSTSVEL